MRPRGKCLFVLLPLILLFAFGVRHMESALALLLPDPMLQTKTQQAAVLSRDKRISVREVWYELSSSVDELPEPRLILYRNGKEFSRTPIAGLNGWYHFENLPEEGDYYVIESPIPGYEVTYSNTGSHSSINRWAYHGGAIIHRMIDNTFNREHAQLYSCIIGSVILLFIKFCMRMRSSY